MEVLDTLEEISNGAHVIYTCAGSEASSDSRTLVCQGDGQRDGICPEDSSLERLLTVEMAREAIENWSSWRGGRDPSPEEKVDAVLYFARNDRYLPG